MADTDTAEPGTDDCESLQFPILDPDRELLRATLGADLTTFEVMLYPLTSPPHVAIRLFVAGDLETTLIPGGAGVELIGNDPEEHAKQIVAWMQAQPDYVGHEAKSGRIGHYIFTVGTRMRYDDVVMP